jgi:cysteine desulfurase
MFNNGIYLDYNATTPVHSAVLKKMLPFFSSNFGNAASVHFAGWQASEAIKLARENVATAIKSETSEVYFTSGATESINLAIRGVMQAYTTKGKHIISFATEHKAVLDTLKAIESTGAEITLLPVNFDGLPDLVQLENAIRNDTIMVIAMMANNETGVIFPVKEMAKIAHHNNTLFFCDATQAFGKIPVSVTDLNVDILALSAHKTYGPKGVGALYLKRKNPRVSIIPQITGGGHENGKRSGTLNVAGIVGLGEVACMHQTFIDFYSNEVRALRDCFEDEVMKWGNVVIQGARSERLPNTTNFSINGIKADVMLASIPSLACSTGSACSSSLPEPSHVLKAMGISDERAHATIRVSLGIITTKVEVNTAISLLKNKLAY